MSVQGWYYLHTNGSLIYKRELGGTAADIRESPFARALWACDPDPIDRESAWAILVEALSLGADKDRIADLAGRWGCNDSDADTYAERVGAVLQRDGSAWMAVPTWFENLAESPAGFGDTKLEAMAALCKALGYRASKMWGASFADLLKPKPERAVAGATA